MPDLTTLNRELTDDPLIRGYAAMTDEQASDDLFLMIRRLHQ